MSEKKPHQRHKRLNTTRKKKPKQKRKTTKKFEGQATDRNSVNGTDDRAILIARRAMELRARGYYLHEISPMLAQEFGLSTPYSNGTISDMCNRARLEAMGDVRTLARQVIYDKFASLEAILRNYLPVATGDVALGINRLEFTPGEGFSVVLDENPWKEKAKAAEICIKAMLAQARILGIDATNDLAGGKSPRELQEWLQAFLLGTETAQHIQPQSGKQIPGKVIDIVPPTAPAAKLVLRSGIPEMDDDAV